MKKIIFISLLSLTSCDDISYSGYVINKNYVKGHMCCDKNTENQRPSFMTHVSHDHVWIKSQFILTVSSEGKTESFHVDSARYASIKLADKITITKR